MEPVIKYSYKKRRKSMNKKKMNNKGFSLVELIIVIAIMAILIGVLAPQFMKYVERSRNSTDKQNAGAFISAMQVWGAETDVPTGETALAAGTYVIEVTSSGTTITGAAAVSALKNAGLADSTGACSTTCKSKTAWTSYKLTFTVDSNLNISVVSDPTDVLD
jgi:type IV pilus assembly protein PilA